MSEPITLSSTKFTAYAARIAQRAAEWAANAALEPSEAISSEAIGRLCRDIRVFLERMEEHTSAASASPPRVPVSSAQTREVGVESGPGQPMDICDLLKVAEGWGDPAAPAAVLAREAAAEIARLREQVQTERRAGIEEAAQIEDDSARGWEAQSWQDQDAGMTYGNLASLAREKAKRIRALADKPLGSNQ